MVPRAKTRIGEIDLQCACGNWIPYPGDNGAERWPSVCPDCGTEWYVQEPVLCARALPAA
jgi:hypothetical protein